MRILDAIVDAFFGVIAFFANLSISRYDDPVVAEFKRRKIACVVSTCVFAIVVVLGVVLASLLDSLATSRTLGAMFDGVRAPIAYAFLAASLGSTIYVVYSYYALWRFTQDGGGFDA
jgi:hypothetical protein